jgi:hypothetical protein
MSSTPSLTRSTSCGGVPPPLIAGRIWHFSLLADSAAILVHHGPITCTEAIACGFQMWWNLSVTSCAIDGSATAAAAAARA